MQTNKKEVHKFVNLTSVLNWT